MAFVDVRNLSVSFGGKKSSAALSGFSIGVEKGEICAVVGPSGCGKSTFLNVLSGVVRTYAGDVLINGTSPDPERHNIGYIPQSYGLLPWLKVRDNIMLGARIRGVKVQEDFLNDVLDALDLRDDSLSRYPSCLSGGQRQRAALARVLVQQPELMLMDEPFSALDAIIASRGRSLMRKVLREKGTTTVFITHNIEEAVFMSDRIAVMSASPGHVLSVMDNPFSGSVSAEGDRGRFVACIMNMMEV